MNFLKSMLILGISLQIFSSLSFADDSAKWNQLLAQAVRDGKTTQTPAGDYRSLSRMKPSDPHQAHQADDFSVVGGLDSHGVFGVGHVEVVSENWQINTHGDWDVDQWLFIASNVGVMTWSRHYHLVESNTGVVVSHDMIAADDQTKAAQWAKAVSFWEN